MPEELIQYRAFYGTIEVLTEAHDVPRGVNPKYTITATSNTGLVSEPHWVQPPRSVFFLNPGTYTVNCAFLGVNCDPVDVAVSCGETARVKFHFHGRPVEGYRPPAPAPMARPAAAAAPPQMSPTGPDPRAGYASPTFAQPPSSGGFSQPPSGPPAGSGFAQPPPPPGGGFAQPPPPPPGGGFAQPPPAPGSSFAPPPPPPNSPSGPPPTGVHVGPATFAPPPPPPGASVTGPASFAPPPPPPGAGFAPPPPPPGGGFAPPPPPPR